MFHSGASFRSFCYLTHSALCVGVMALLTDSTFHNGIVERFDVSQWYCGEIRRFTMLRRLGLAFAGRAGSTSSISVNSIISRVSRAWVFPDC